MESENKLCSVEGCDKKHNSKGLCKMHYLQQWRKEHEYETLWHMLKSSAKRRDIEFNITVDELRAEIGKTPYMQNKGRFLENYNIDRIRQLEGYKPGNIQVITKEENLDKWHKQEKTVWNRFKRTMGPDTRKVYNEYIAKQSAA